MCTSEVRRTVVHCCVPQGLRIVRHVAFAVGGANDEQSLHALEIGHVDLVHGADVRHHPHRLSTPGGLASQKLRIP